MSQQNIQPGSAPLLWSTIDEAFNRINSNFTELYLTISAGSSGAVDLTNLTSSLVPNTSGTYDLGSSTRRWKDLYLNGNSIDLGGALITSANGSTVNLPAGSTIGDILIRNPAESNFSYVAVTGQSNIQASGFSDTLTVASGNVGISLATTPGTNTLSISNAGVISLAGTAGQIGVSTSTGAVTLTNLGVTRVVSGGLGITVNSTGPSGTGIVTISASAIQPTFKTVATSTPGQASFNAVSTADTITINGSGTTTVTTNPGTKTLTITGSSSFDLRGSVFADDSTLLVDSTNGVLRGTLIGTVVGDLKGSVFGDDSSVLVDAVGNYIYGNVSATTLRTAESKIALGASAGSITQGNNATAVGWLAGYNNQGTAAVAVGRESGEINQGQYAVAVGPGAGYTGQGANAVAIGYNAGQTSQHANSIILNATGTAVNSDGTGRFFVDPIRTTGSGVPLMYNAISKEIIYSNVLEFIGSTISTTDSSGLTVDVQTTFNTDVTFQNDITILERLTVKGSRVINISELKSIVAASTDFANFKTRIAALA